MGYNDLLPLLQYLGFGAPANISSGRRAVTNDALTHLPEGQSAREENEEKDALLQQVEAQDLIKFGLIPEFCGRFPVNVSLKSLNEDMLVRILTEPQNALVVQFEVLFKMDKVSEMKVIVFPTSNSQKCYIAHILNYNITFIRFFFILIS